MDDKSRKLPPFITRTAKPPNATAIGTVATESTAAQNPRRYFPASAQVLRVRGGPNSSGMPSQWILSRQYGGILQPDQATRSFRGHRNRGGPDPVFLAL